MKLPNWFYCHHKHLCWCKKVYGKIIGVILGIILAASLCGCAAKTKRLVVNYNSRANTMEIFMPDEEPIKTLPEISIIYRKNKVAVMDLRQP